MRVSHKYDEYLWIAVDRLKCPSKTEKGIEKHIEENPQQFSYGGVSYSDYESKYRSCDYIPRKLAAIPFAASSGFMSIYHLAKAIFYDLPKACTGETRHVKADIYRSARDLEEAVGWMVTIFNDKLGTYLTQEGAFHKECYDDFEKAQINKEEADRIAQLQAAKKEKISGIPVDELQKQLDTMGDDLQFISNDQLGKLDITGLDLTNLARILGTLLHTVKLTSPENKARFACIPTAQIQTIFSKLGCLKKLLSDDHLKELDYTKLSESKDDFKALFANLGAKRIVPYLNTVQILDILNKYSDSEAAAWAVLRNDRHWIRRGGLSEVRKWTQEENLSYSRQREYEECKGSQQAIFDQLQTNQIQAILADLRPSQMKFIADKHLGGLDITGLSILQLENLFFDRARERLTCLRGSQVQTILSKLETRLLRWISNNQLKSFDFDKLSKDELSLLFFSLSEQDIISEYQKNPRDKHSTKSGDHKDLVERVKKEREDLNRERFASLSLQQMESIQDKLTQENLELMNIERTKKQKDLASLD